MGMCSIEFKFIVKKWQRVAELGMCSSTSSKP